MYNIIITIIIPRVYVSYQCNSISIYLQQFKIVFIMLLPSRAPVYIKLLSIQGIFIFPI